MSTVPTTPGDIADNNYAHEQASLLARGLVPRVYALYHASAEAMAEYVERTWGTPTRVTTNEDGNRIVVELDADPMTWVQLALANWRDGEDASTSASGPRAVLNHPDHGELALEEVKYCIVDPATPGS